MEIPHRAVLDSVNGFDVIECKACGFAHVIPIPDEQLHMRYYEKDFYQSKNNYIEKHKEDLEWWSIEHNEKYDFFDFGLAERKPKRPEVLQ